jgi:hypothetical protein
VDRGSGGVPATFSGELRAWELQEGEVKLEDESDGRAEGRR